MSDQDEAHPMYLTCTSKNTAREVIEQYINALKKEGKMGQDVTYDADHVRAYHDPKTGELMAFEVDLSDGTIAVFEFAGIVPLDDAEKGSMKNDDFFIGGPNTVQ